MKKFFLGMIIGAAITGGIFYYINKQNENEAREDLKSFLASMKDSKTTQEHLDELLNDPKATMASPSTIIVVAAANDELYYFKGNDCSKLIKTDLINIKEVLSTEKQHAAPDKLMIIIKKMPGVSYRNSVDLLDAITGAGIPPGHFAEVNLSENEKNCIQNYKNH